MRHTPRLLTAILLISMMTLTACSEGKIPQEQVTFKTLKEIPESTWEKLSKKRIFFGHQSVGYNIVDGVEEIMRENPIIKLNIVETANPDDFKHPLFAHARVGKNEMPQSKIDAFADSIRHGLGNRTDIAFFKFCYVDIKPETNVEKVLSSYKDIMASLKETYPKTTLIHVTAPLTTRQSGIKAWIKKIIGKPVRGIDDNIKRNQFNDLLRKEYTRKEPVFDLAAIECTAPDGTRASFVKNGKTYYQLVSDYTNDGGHLNERGRKKVAEQLLILLAELSQ